MRERVTHPLRAQSLPGSLLAPNFLRGCVVDPVPRGGEQDEICHLENCCYSSHTSDAASSSNWQTDPLQHTWGLH